MSAVFLMMPSGQGFERLCRPHLSALFRTKLKEHIITGYDSYPGFKLCT